jgi:hypothetical protein
VAELTARRGLLVLDSGGVSAIAAGNGVARAALERARREGWLVVIPAPVLVEVHTGRRDHAGMLIETTPERAREAGELRSRSGVLDVVDAIAVAEAVAAQPALILTSDPDDIRALVEAASAVGRVLIIAV